MVNIFSNEYTIDIQSIELISYCYSTLPIYHGKRYNGKIDLLGKNKIEDRFRQLIKLTYNILDRRLVLLLVSPNELNRLI